MLNESLKTNYGVNEFVADETAAHLRADQFKCSGQIVCGFMVVVLQLMQDLFKKQIQLEAVTIVVPDRFYI